MNQQNWPLTSAQYGIWLGQKIAGNSPRYNTAEYIVIKGYLNVKHFLNAIDVTLEQAHGLHMIFDMDHAIQRKSYPARFLVQIDVSDHDAPYDEAWRWMHKEITIPCAIDNGQLYQIALIKIDTQTWIFFLKIHHIACDGFSFALLQNTIINTYTQKNCHFGDYYKAVDECVTFEKSTYYDESNQFWLRQYRTQDRIPSFSSRQSEISETSIRCENILPKHWRIQLEDQLKNMTQQDNIQGINWTTLLISTVAFILSQKRASRRVTLGVPVMSRMGTLAINVPMMCMNIIPISITINKNFTFSKVISEVATTLKSCLKHQRYRYEHLRSHARKIASGTPSNLWGPVVNVLPFPRTSKMGQCTLTYGNISSGPVEDISITFITQPDQSIRLTIDANPARYSQNTLQEITETIYTFLMHIKTNIHTKIHYPHNHLSWIADPLFQKKLNPTPEIDQKLAISFEKNSDKIAIVDAQNQLTYGQLKQIIEKYKQQLNTLNIKAGTRCAIALPRGIDAIALCLACVQAKITFLFLDPAAPIRRNLRILDDCSAQLLVVQNNTGAKTYSNILPTAICIQHQLCVVTPSPSPPNTEAHTEECYIIYTSGSTGSPKGVIITDTSLSEFISAAVQRYQFTKKDHILQFAPLHFDACIEEIFCTFYTGATLYLRNDIMLHSIPDFLSQCEEWKITLLDLPTAYWHELTYAVTTQRLHLPDCIQAVIIGGEAANPERIQQWKKSAGTHVRLYNSYGPTEGTVVATVADLHKAATLAGQGTPLGDPLSGRALAVVDTEGNILPKGESGELLLLGSGLAKGYINQPTLTSEAFIFVDFPWLSVPTRAYRSGDRVTISANNQVRYEGRIDDEIKISGHRIAPAEIETALEALPLTESAVITLIKQHEQIHIVAHIVKNTNITVHSGDITIAKLRQHLAETLPSLMLPNYLLIHPSLPKTSSGKIDRKTLAQEAEDTLQNHNTSNDHLSIMRGFWQAILGTSHYDAKANFFALGGQSLQVIQLANRLSEHCGTTVAASVLFQHPTLSAMSAAVFNKQHHQPDSKKIKASIFRDCQQFKEAITIQKKSVIVNSDNSILDKAILTGATGFVGIHLLFSLLNNSTCNVTCLIRANNLHHAHQRLHHASKKYLGNTSIVETNNHRISIVVCDFEREDLGLNEDQARDIFSSASHIFHSAAITSVTRSYDSLRLVNTSSCKALLQHAITYNCAFRLMSTVAIAPPRDDHTQLEETFVPYHTGLSDGYQQSKWAAENIVKIAQDNGADVRIYRLGRVCGSTTFAYVDDKDLIWQILACGLHHGYLPDMNISEPWVCADDLSNFIVRNQSEIKSRTVFNIVPDQQVDIIQIYQWLRQSGYHFDVLPIDRWADKVSQNAREQDSALLTFFSQKKQASQNGFQAILSDACNTHFSNQLLVQKQKLTAVDHHLFISYLVFAQQHLSFPSPPSNKREQQISQEESA